MRTSQLLTILLALAGIAAFAGVHNHEFGGLFMIASAFAFAASVIIGEQAKGNPERDRILTNLARPEQEKDRK